MNSYRFDKQVYDFLDHIILRTYTNKNMRTHFPIIIESNNNRFFSREIFDVLGIKNFDFPIIEMYGFIYEDLENSLGHIF